MVKHLDMGEVKLVGNVNEQISKVEDTLNELRGAVLSRDPLEVATCQDELDDQVPVLLSYLRVIVDDDEDYDDDYDDDEVMPRFTEEEKLILKQAVKILNQEYAGEHTRMFQPGRERYELEFPKDLLEYPGILHDFATEESEPLEKMEFALDFIMSQCYWAGKEDDDA